MRGWMGARGQFDAGDEDLMQTHTSGALRAAQAIDKYLSLLALVGYSPKNFDAMVEIIDRETGALEMLEALEALVTATENADNYADQGLPRDDDTMIRARIIIQKARNGQ